MRKLTYETVGFVRMIRARQEMAQRLSFDWSTSVTVGRAVADWLAARKGTYLGVMEVDEAAEQAAKEQTDHLPTRTLEIMVGTRIIRIAETATVSCSRNTYHVSYLVYTRGQGLCYSYVLHTYLISYR